MTTAIQQMYHEWKQLRASAHGTSEEDCDAAVEEMMRIEDAMLEIPSQSAADFAAKVLAYTSHGDFGLTGDGIGQILGEACNLIGEPVPGFDGKASGRLPWYEMQAAETRMERFCEIVGAEPPATLLDAEGAPTDELMDFVREQELSLDWLFLGDVTPLLRAYRTTHAQRSPAALRERVDLLAAAAGIEPVGIEIADGEAVLTDDLIAFCDEANGSLDWLLTGDVGELLRSHRAFSEQRKPFMKATRNLSDNEKKALVFTLRLIVEGTDVDDAMQTFTRVVEEQGAA
ncbi:hypothetical protein ROJ8625_00924 [Roseivivax jejudonensis]|uniref:Uncharacterized protein n=1 Tax=Roseivivax jejudonensis TaxID=1529041 RepID=A0A1X6YJL2_9RHOB|nr:hypothetical protein [Roseivivax jejudonensis]SLN23189.1 hypothetical protein ROJ8625_00924 [Roseivivax jejudonensis]